MEEIAITLETLYDILRNEKKREDLQKLSESFFFDVVAYLREKKSLLDNSKDQESPFAVGEKEKLEYELRSIRRILKEIYEKREKKIIDIALNRSRTGSDIIDTSSMLREEKEFYNSILERLDQFRRGILFSVFSLQVPIIHASQIPLMPPPSSSSSSSPPPGTAKVNSEGALTKIKFLHPVPSFVWKDLKVYGPFDSGDVTDIFPEVAELMVRKGRAEKMQQ